MRRTLVVTAVILGMAVSGGCAKGKKHSAASAGAVRPNPRPRPQLWAQNSPAHALANAVMNASGAPRWDMVRVVGFRYVEREGERVVASRRHVWDVAGGVETVYLPEGAITINVLSPNSDDPAQSAAMRAFVSDTQFLVAPMRIGAGSGVALEYGGSATVNGKPLEILRISNLSGTPGWRQQWYVDPLTGLVMYCDEAPEADPEARRRVTWEGYRNVGPFRLPTVHRFVGDVRSIAIEDLRVEW